MRTERADPCSVSAMWLFLLWGRIYTIIYIIPQSIIYTNCHGHQEQDECIQISTADIWIKPIILYSYFLCNHLTGNFELRIDKSLLCISCNIINSVISAWNINKTWKLWCCLQIQHSLSKCRQEVERQHIAAGFFHIAFPAFPTTSK